MFYATLPALNIQSKEFYGFAIMLCIVYMVCALFSGRVYKTEVYTSKCGIKEFFARFKIPSIIIAVLIAVMVIGGISSAELIRARAYRSLITVTEGDFTSDVKEISFNKIPYLDKDLGGTSWATESSANCPTW